MVVVRQRGYKDKRKQLSLYSNVDHVKFGRCTCMNEHHNSECTLGRGTYLDFLSYVGYALGGARKATPYYLDLVYFCYKTRFLATLAKRH